MKLKMKGLLKQTEFYVFCIIVAFALIIQVRSGLFFTSNNLMDLVRSTHLGRSLLHNGTIRLGTQGLQFGARLV